MDNIKWTVRGMVLAAFACCDLQFSVCGPASAQTPAPAPVSPATALVDEARALVGKGQIEAALAVLTQAIAADPQNFFAWRNRGHTYLNARDPDRALSDYAAALKIRPASPDLITNVGDAYGMKGDRPRAIAEYTKALGLAPAHASALNNRGVAYRDSGQYGLAMADFNALIQYQPRDAAAYANRAATWQRLGKLSDALADYDRALILDPRHKFALNGKASTQQAIALQSTVPQSSAPQSSVPKPQPSPPSVPMAKPSPAVADDDVLTAKEVTAVMLRDHMLPRIKALPNVKGVEKSNDPALLSVTRASDEKFEVGLSNLLLRLKTAPLLERRSMIDNQLRVIVDMLDKPAVLSREQFIAALRPVLKNAEFLKEIGQRFAVSNGPVKKLPIFRPLAADIVVVLGIDSERTIQFVSADEGKQYGLTDDELLEAAKKNLRERVSAVKLIDVGPVKLIDFDTSYNASLVLIDEIWSTVAPGAGDDLIVAVPARDAIAFGRASNQQSVTALRRLATIPAQAYGISSVLLQRQGKGWVVFKGSSL
jgi:Tfp pilus assembly protein PilF